MEKKKAHLLHHNRRFLNGFRTFRLDSNVGAVNELRWLLRLVLRGAYDSTARDETGEAEFRF